MSFAADGEHDLPLWAVRDKLDIGGVPRKCLNHPPGFEGHIWVSSHRRFPAAFHPDQREAGASPSTAQRRPHAPAFRDLNREGEIGTAIPLFETCRVLVFPGFRT